MAFPATSLDVRLVFAFGANLAAAPTSWTFKDCTADLRTTSDTSVAIKVGRSNRGQQGEPNNATLELNNLAGQYTVDNPAGANYPNVVENVPGIVGTARNLNPSFESNLSDWTVVGATPTQSFVRAAPTQPAGLASMLLTAGGVTAVQASMGQIPVRPGGYVYLDCWVYSAAGSTNYGLNVNWLDSGSVLITNSPGGTTTIPAGVWTYMSLFAGPAPSNAAYCVGQYLQVGVPGAGSQTWIDEARLVIPELCGFVDGWTPQFDDSGKLATVSVSMSSSRRRLGQNEEPLRSALERAIVHESPLEYWPMEDGASSTQIGSALVGHTPATPTGLTFASNATLTGSAPLPAFTATGSITGVVTATPSGSQWQWDWHYLMPGNPGADTVVMQINTTGTVVTWQYIVLNGGTTYSIKGYDITGALVVNRSLSTLPADPVSGAWSHWSFYVQDGGSGTVNYAFHYYPSLGGIGLADGGSFSGTPGRPVGWGVPASAGLNGTALGHVVLYDAYNYTQPGLPAFGYAGETGAARLTRLFGEESLPVAAMSSPDLSMPMGPQLVKTFLDLLQECESADGGMLYEPFDSFGFAYLMRSDLYNLPVALTVDQAADQLGPPFAPVHDDAIRQNNVTVTRQGGSFAQYVGDTSRGTYKDTPTLNVATDGVLLNIAAWRVHLGTPRGRLRYPSLNLNFANTNAAAFGPAFAATRGVGIRVQVLNPPAGLQNPDVLISGYTKTLAYKAWKVSLLGSPYDPWLVGALNSSLRLEMAGQTLQSSLAPGALSLSLATAAGHQLFTTSAAYPADFPLDLNVAGWRIHVTAASGASSPQTLTITAAPNTATIPAGTPVTLWQPAAMAL